MLVLDFDLMHFPVRTVNAILRGEGKKPPGGRIFVVGGRAGRGAEAVQERGLFERIFVICLTDSMESVIIYRAQIAERIRAS